MAESQRKQTTSAPALKTDGQGKKDSLTLIGFLIGGIGLVSGMLWLANGLSDNFSIASTSFILFAVCMGITAAIFIGNKFLLKD